MPRNIFFLFLAVGLVIAGGPTIYYVSAWLRAAEGRGWPTVEGRILSVGVEERVSRSSDGDRTVTHYPRIVYAYRVGDRELRGKRVWLTGNQFYNDRYDAAEFARGYRVGQRVPVSVDPARPEDAALLIENPPWQILLFSAVGIGWIWLSVWFRRYGPGGTHERKGTCRSCKVRLPVGEFARRETAPASDFHAIGRRRQTGGSICPRCGVGNPLNSMRNRPELIIFLVMFFGIWAALIYFIFFF